MGDYPEHDKQAEVIEQTQAIGEFLDWLSGQGVQLMIWREDLTDSRLTDPVCPVSFTSDDPQSCDQIRDEGDDREPRAWWRRHCKHWQSPDLDRDIEWGTPGECCRCHKGQHYEITSISSWVHESRSVTQLLADWAGIDLKKIEDEKRQMLAKIRQGV